MITQLRAQLHHAQETGLLTILRDSAAAHNVELALVLAIASRETSIRNIMGDGGHGHGVMQIDDRSWPKMCANDIHTHCREYVDYGLRILLNNIQQAETHYPKFTQQQHLKIAISAYNCGFGGAMHGVAMGDSDKRTTGANYAHDVLERMIIFRKLLAEQK